VFIYIYMEHVLFGLSTMAVPDDFGTPETFHPAAMSTTFEIWQTWRPMTLAPETHAWQNDTLEHPRHTTDNEGMTIEGMTIEGISRHGRRLLTNAIDVRGPPNPPPTTPAGWSRALEEAGSREGLENSLKRSLAVFKAMDAEADKKKADSKDDSDDAQRNKITPEDENTKKDKNYKENGNVNFWMTCPLEILPKVMKFASLNPKDHCNQVAITNRRNNIVWRRLVMNSEYQRRLDRRMILTHYIYDIIPRMNDELDCDVPVYPLLHDLLPLL
jgi:hypothetical protein